ncbi:MAG: ABC transporter permease subunit [Candidatus Thermoplasmatota archaeon]|nr:ABC transporter permease subunit [Candidatus Thermoplasmatota archaeon]
MFNHQTLAVARRIFIDKIRSTRMVIMLPILILFIPGMAWGFSDPEIMLPGGITPDSVMEVMFYTSLGVVFAGTMCGVLLSFDGISKDRFSGVLEVKLSQPMPRQMQSAGIAIGHWSAILIPVWILWLVSILIASSRLEMSPSLSATIASFAYVGLILFWYVMFSLIASTYSKDQGTSIAFGVGMWFLFTFLWALVTSMVAFASGVNVGEINNPEMIRIEGFLDLLSPNGVFHHLLETNLADVDRGVPKIISWISAIIWTILPWFWFQSRMSRIQP